MTEGYGNIDWKFFVFFAYGIVAVTLGAYAIFSIKRWESAEKSFAEEGFSNEELEEKN